MGEKKCYTAFVGFGSNIGDGKQILAKAWKRLGEEDGVELTTISSPFFSDPMGMESENTFTNCVGRLETSLTPAELLKRLLHIEEEFGRQRLQPEGGPEDRSLDLDILYFSTLSINEDDLVVPHPRIRERLFTLVPMAEIEPTYVDPVTKESVVSMCRDIYGRMREGIIEEQVIERSTWDEGLIDIESLSVR